MAIGKRTRAPRIRTSANPDTTCDPDAKLLELCERHARLWTKAENHPDKFIPYHLIREVDDVQLRILTTPAFTALGLKAKRRVAELAERDDRQLVDAILAADGKRVGVNVPAGEAAAG